MQVIEKTKQALAVAEKCGFESIITISASQFDHEPARIHLSDITELTGYDCQTVEHTDISREVFALVEGVRVFSLIDIEENAA